MKTLMNAAQGALERAGLWRGDAKLLCAVSGGADSMALLHALCRLREEKAFFLAAVHVQHGLRGESSLEDERFVRSWCKRLCIPLQVETAGLEGGMDTPGIELEARLKRREIFERQMDALGCEAVVLAHHRDDQTETVLMHLMRGAGAEGLCGMREASPLGHGIILRPFLPLSRQAIRQALGELPYREDESNAVAVAARNALRLEILPKLETLFPGAAEHTAQTAQLMQSDADCLNDQAKRLFQQALYGEKPLWMLDWQLLSQFPPALGRRALRMWWREGLKRAGLAPEEEALGYDDTLKLASLRTQMNLPMGLKAQAGERWLHLLWQDGSYLTAAEPFETELPARRVPHLTLCAQPARRIPQDSSEILLTPRMLEQKPVFRLPQPGDRIWPLGAPGAKPLRRFFTDRKTDPALRAVWPVLAAGCDVWWVPGLCQSEQLRAGDICEDSVCLSGTPDFCL